MRTLYFILVVFALGTAGMIWSLSGIGGVYGPTDPIGDTESADALEAQAANSSANNSGSLNGSARAGDDANLIGVIITGISTIVNFGGTVVLLPFELQNLGFPRYFAYPVGLLAQAFVGIGIVQWATNRFYQ